MDTLDINDAHYDRKILDLQRRYDEQYDTIEDIEVQIGELQGQIRSIQQEKISGNNIYRLLLAFDEVYHSATEAEQKEFMKAFIERIEMFPEKRKDGSWIRKIVFNFPVPVDGEEVKELPLETETTVETVVLLSQLKQKPDVSHRKRENAEVRLERICALQRGEWTACRAIRRLPRQTWNLFQVLIYLKMKIAGNRSVQKIKRVQLWRH